MGLYITFPARWILKLFKHTTFWTATLLSAKVISDYLTNQPPTHVELVKEMVMNYVTNNSLLHRYIQDAKELMSYVWPYVKNYLSPLYGKEKEALAVLWPGYCILGKLTKSRSKEGWKEKRIWHSLIETQVNIFISPRKLRNLLKDT